MLRLLIISCLIICNFLLIYSEHFYGGTVTWKPMNRTATCGNISIMITQSYQWSLAKVFCNQNMIINRNPLIPGGNSTGIVQCVTKNSSCGGYQPINISGYCTDFSNQSQTSSSQISTVQNIQQGSKFCIAYAGGNWATLQTTNCSSGRKKRISDYTMQINRSIVSLKNIGKRGTSQTCSSTSLHYSVGCCIDLSPRSAGLINSPPVATMISPIKVPINTTTTIKIPVIDADNDFIRCRWAEKTSQLDECSDVCQTTPDTIVNENCTLTFDSTGKQIGDVYAIALMVEDFYNQSSNTSYSSVPIQFLIKIIGTPSCSLKPTIKTTLSDCTPIRVKITFNFTVTIEHGCSNTTITEFSRVPPLNMFKSNITLLPTRNISTVTEIWTPSSDQTGSQVYCAIAMDSDGIQSDMYCTTFTVVSKDANMTCPGLYDNQIDFTSTTIIDTTVEQTIEVTVLVLIPTADRSRDIALSIGLGVPLLTFIIGYILSRCCCQSPNKTVIKNQNIKTMADPKPTPDYREQYINSKENTLETAQSNESNEENLVQAEASFISRVLSDYNIDNLNVTHTSLFSPSVATLPTDDTQFTTNDSFSTANLMNRSSFLVHSYYEQELQRYIDASKTSF